MLEFESSTLANMTAALETGCKMLSGDFDTPENRKRIGDALIGAARLRKSSLLHLTEVAQEEAAAIIEGSKPPRAGSILKRLKLSS